MNTPIEVSPGEGAAAFLQSVNSTGPWAVATIHPDTGRIQCEYFADLDSVRAWADRNDGERNCYYIPHPTRAPSGNANRTTKSDAVEFRFHHADYDLDKLEPGDEWSDLPLDDRKRRCIEALRDLKQPGPPTFIVDTGGGVQALWRLDDPMRNDKGGREQTEGYNRTLTHVVPGGDDSCWDCMHLLRLLGLMNLPNAKKRERGRTPVRARLVEGAGPTYSTNDFVFSLQFTPPRVPKADVDIDVGAPQYTDTDQALTALADLHDLEPWCVDVIRDGVSDAPMGKDTSRSAWLFRAVRHMIDCWMPNETILGLLLDSRWDISSHITESRRSDDQRLAYAIKQIRDAYGANVADEQKRVQEARDDFREPPDEEWTRDDVAVVVDEMRQRFTQQVGLIGLQDPSAIPRTPWLVEGLLLRRDITLLGGMGGTGKSLFLWQVCVSVATATEFAGWQPDKPRKVLVLSGEDDFDEIERRVVAACQAMGVDRTTLEDRFSVLQSRRIRMATKGKDGTIKDEGLWAMVRWAIKN